MSAEQPAAEAEGKKIPYEELSKHKTYEDCWVLIKGKVYNVTNFLDEHPGGFDIVLDSSGKDATEDFESIGHSKSAIKLLDKYYIGDVEGAPIEEPGVKVTTALVLKIYQDKQNKAASMEFRTSGVVQDVDAAAGSEHMERVVMGDA